MTTKTNPQPDVPLPAGADFGDIWEGDEPERVVTGPRRGISAANVDAIILDVRDPAGRWPNRA
jgi:hypothetical protein